MMRHPLAMDTYDSDTETSEDEDFTRVIMIIQLKRLAVYFKTRTM